MPNIFKMSNAGGMDSALIARYSDMLAGNTVWNPYSPTGAYDALATVTLSSAQSSITFSGIPNTYTHLQIRGIANSATADAMRMYFNTDTGGSSTNYTSHYLKGDGSSATAGNYVSIGKFVTGQDIPATTNLFSTSIIDILDYTNTNKNRVFRALSGLDANGSGSIQLASGVWTSSTAALTQITLAPSTYNFSAGTSYALYGIR